MSRDQRPEPIEERLARHAPDHPDTRRLERSRRMLDDAIFLEDTGVTVALGATPESPARRRGWRLAVPVAAAVGLGVGIVLWPSPAVTPSAFADWTQQPAPAGGLDAGLDEQLEACRTEAASQDLLVVMSDAELAARAAAEAAGLAQLERMRLEEEGRAGEGAGASEGEGEGAAVSEGEGEGEGELTVVVPPDRSDVVVTVDERFLRETLSFDDLAPTVVDSRGAWTVSILVEDAPQRLEGGDGVVGYLRTELTCMTGPSGTSVIGVAMNSVLISDVDDASILSVSVADWPTWSQASGHVGPAADRVVVTLEDGTEIEATVAPASSGLMQVQVRDDGAVTVGDVPVGEESGGEESGDNAPTGGESMGATLEVVTAPTGRSWIAWWPTDREQSRAVSVTSYAADGTIGQVQQLD